MTNSLNNTPNFPSLYWPFTTAENEKPYLYDARPMWRFTLYWTIIFVGGVHLGAALWACATHYQNWKVIWVVPVVYLFVGGIEAAVAGNLVGGLLSAVYTAGSFGMSTWIPASWGVINALVLILSSFAVQGGL